MSKYKPYTKIAWYNKGDRQFWCCSCKSGPDNDNIICCSICNDNVWGHISCHDLDDLNKLQLKQLKHKCFDCLSLSTRNNNYIRDKDKKDEKKIDHKINKRKWYCSKCDKSFKTGQALGGHMSIHNKENNMDRDQNRNINIINDDDCNEDKNNNDNNEYDEWTNNYNALFLNDDEIRSLQVGDTFDHKDNHGRFLPSSIVAKQPPKFKIHYERYDAKFDIWRNYTKTKNTEKQFARYKSISNRQNHRFPQLIITDNINVKRVDIDKWEYCEIIGIDDQRINGKSGQIKVTNNNDYKYWYHPDSSDVQLIKMESNIMNERKRKRECIKDEIICIGSIENESNRPKKKRKVMNIESVNDVNDVLSFFHYIGYGELCGKLKPQFVEDEMDGNTLKLLDLNDLKSYGIKRLYDRKMILSEIQKLS